jgi:UDP-GlcNAc:undecaprenyl-phosphate/decaprenyl-phosphate GlcNAc-1-phosphate transferase
MITAAEVTVGLTSTAAGLVVSHGAASAARRFGIVAAPNPLVQQHTIPVAYLGGVAVAVAAAVGMFAGWLIAAGRLSAGTTVNLPAIAVGGTLALVVGVVDDLRPLQAAQKLAAQTAFAVVAVALGLSPRWTGVRLLDVSAAILLILLAVNALNLIDVCDGLAGGVAAVILGFFFLAGGNDKLVALALAAACVGFLTLNFPPARIFLGDAGTHLLGFVIASLALANAGRPGAVPFVSVLLALGLPLFELVFVTVVRVRKGIPWWRGSPDHYALRLQRAGLSRAATAVSSWLAAGLLCTGAWLYWRAPTGRAAVAAMTLAAFAVGWRLLRRCDLPPDETMPSTAVAAVFDKQGG